MKDLDSLPYHPPTEKLVDILCKKTQSTNPLMFRVMVSYYLAKIASMMRCNINTPDRGIIPVNLYAINLAVSGAGKGHSMNILEDHVIHLFRENFLTNTFPDQAEKNLVTLANKRASRKSTDPEDELERIQKEFDLKGKLAFSFDSGTPAAIKQMRDKLLMADAGSINLEMDEIGSNLLANADALTTFLELFDKGKIKQKLTKNTQENVRSEEIQGSTPTNLLLFGTPSKLLNGSKVEDEFFSMLSEGYARRCIFGYARAIDKNLNQTPEEVFDMMTDSSVDTFLNQFSVKLGNLADSVNFNVTIDLEKPVALTLIEYKLNCERLAEEYPEHEEIRKAELSHRYFKALKLAGTYAFIDSSPVVTEDHLYYAIKLVEDSGQAFNDIFTRDRNYVKLAKYIASTRKDINAVDLVEDLPFYKGSESQKRELMTLAIAYGYKNNIIIKRSFSDGIEFFRGETLQLTDINNMTVSYSPDFATGYVTEQVPFDLINQLTQLNKMNFITHEVSNGHRNEENALPGFDMIVIDVDGTAKIDVVRKLLDEYSYHIYTTKSHTDDVHRFRLLMPISHKLKLDAKEFKEFMNNIYEWLPFEVDAQTNQRSRKWACHDMQFWDNDGILLDALPFIPKTSKNEERKAAITDQQSLTNLERWFVNNTATGNRSNQLIKYALMLVDTGMDHNTIQNALLALNNKIQDKMDESEILSTIMITVSKAIYNRDTSKK